MGIFAIFISPSRDNVTVCLCNKIKYIKKVFLEISSEFSVESNVSEILHQVILYKSLVQISLLHVIQLMRLQKQHLYKNHENELSVQHCYQRYSLR